MMPTALLPLPVEPPPGFGGLLLGAVVAHHIVGVDPDLVGDVTRLIGQIERGERNLTLKAVERIAGRIGVDPLDLLADDAGA